MGIQGVGLVSIYHYSGGVWNPLQDFTTPVPPIAWMGIGSGPDDWASFPGLWPTADSMSIGGGGNTDAYGVFSCYVVQMAPGMRNPSPAPEEVDVPVSGPFELDVWTDQCIGVDAHSVVISFDGVPAWQDDSQQPGFAVTKTPLSDGYHYSIVPETPFAGYVWVTCRVQAQNLYGLLDNTYTFRIVDTDPPYLQNLDPVPDATGVATNTLIGLDIVDDGAGVRPDSVIIQVNGITVWRNSQPQPGFVVVCAEASPDGYHYSFAPETQFLVPAPSPSGDLPFGGIPFGIGTPAIPWPYPSGELVVVRVVAEDWASNVLDATYSFRTGGCLVVLNRGQEHGFGSGIHILAFKRSHGCERAEVSQPAAFQCAI